MTHTVGLTVGVNGQEEMDEVHTAIVDLAARFSNNFYTSVHTSLVDDEESTVYEDSAPIETLPGEYADENTLNKVRRALFDLLWTDAQIDEAIHALQNAGILFRERR
jgi:hypothetical protein